MARITAAAVPRREAMSREPPLPPAGSGLDFSMTSFNESREMAKKVGLRLRELATAARRRDRAT